MRESAVKMGGVCLYARTVEEAFSTAAATSLLPLLKKLQKLRHLPTSGEWNTQAYLGMALAQGSFIGKLCGRGLWHGLMRRKMTQEADGRI